MAQDEVIKRRQEALATLHLWKRKLQENGEKVVKAELWCFSDEHLYHAERNNIINKLVTLKQETAELSYWVDFCNTLIEIRSCLLTFNGTTFWISSTLEEGEQYLLPMEFVQQCGPKTLPQLHPEFAL